jgi:hypothetical protein
MAFIMSYSITGSSDSSTVALLTKQTAASSFNISWRSDIIFVYISLSFGFGLGGLVGGFGFISHFVNTCSVTVIGYKVIYAKEGQAQ